MKALMRGPKWKSLQLPMNLPQIPGEYGLGSLMLLIMEPVPIHHGIFWRDDRTKIQPVIVFGSMVHRVEIPPKSTQAIPIKHMIQ